MPAEVRVSCRRWKTARRTKLAPDTRRAARATSEALFQGPEVIGKKWPGTPRHWEGRRCRCYLPVLAEFTRLPMHGTWPSRTMGGTEGSATPNFTTEGPGVATGALRPENRWEIPSRVRFLRNPLPPSLTRLIRDNSPGCADCASAPRHGFSGVPDAHRGESSQKGPRVQATISRMTRPWTSVRRRSMPL